MHIHLKNEEWENIDLNYAGENNFSSFFSSEGNIHSYPAKAVPEMVNSLLIKLKDLYKIESVLDPFVGSGTTALEAKYLGLDFYGSDLNPLAVLLSRTKALTIKNTTYLTKKLNNFTEDIFTKYNNENAIALENFKNIEYWFKEDNIKQLSFIKREIDKFLKNSKKHRQEFCLIILTAFSSTIRMSSLSRNGEFKLYRMSPNDIKKFHVNSILVFKDKVKELLDMLVFANKSYKKETISEIYLENAKSLSYLLDKKIDLVITSPPYGDSQSTVAYGQFSRLSIQWMDELIKKYLKISYIDENCDQYLLGGKKSQIKTQNMVGFYNSETLNDLINKMDLIIDKELKKNQNAKNDLLKIIRGIEKHGNVKETTLKSNKALYDLIRERIRLDIFRKINKSNLNLNNRQIKEIAKIERDNFFVQLFSSNAKVAYRRWNQLLVNLPFVIQTISRKIQSQPKRRQEVIDFFKDLYQVVLETDRILSDDGIQTWIVGHRTVFGEITVNMEGVLKDWFKNMGYSLITTLERKYSFKRMPHHINSTVSRDAQVQTMMNEYILIVKK